MYTIDHRAESLTFAANLARLSLRADLNSLLSEFNGPARSELGDRLADRYASTVRRGLASLDAIVRAFEPAPARFIGDGDPSDWEDRADDWSLDDRIGLGTDGSFEPSTDDLAAAFELLGEVMPPIAGGAPGDEPVPFVPTDADWDDYAAHCAAVDELDRLDDARRCGFA